MTNFVLYAIIFSLFLTAVIFFVLYRSRKEILTREIEKRDLEIQYQKDLVVGNIRTLEQERSRIARELHDGIASKLSAIRMQIIVNKVKPDISAEIASVIENTRRLSYDLIPLILENFGLYTAIKELAGEIHAGSTLSVRLNVSDQVDMLDKSKQLHIYRIIQELLHNTLKYARAQQAEIRMVLSDNRCELYYGDDGIGSDPDHLVAGGLGIRNLIARCDILQAGYTFNTGPGSGFKFKLDIP